MYKIQRRSKIYSRAPQMGSQIYTTRATPLRRPEAENFFVPEKSIDPIKVCKSSTF